MTETPSRPVVTAFGWVPEFARGLVRDLRVRWALEEIGREYDVELLNARAPRPEEYLARQPFDQVPAFRDGDLNLFETGAILLYLGEQDERLLPASGQDRWTAIAWLFSALNSVEPALNNVVLIDVFYRDEEWAKLRRPGAADFARLKLKRLSDWLGDKQWLEGDRFTIGDLMMVTVLRVLRHTDIVAEFPNLEGYRQRGQARPAFQRALADQLATYREHAPEGVPV